MKSFFLVLFSVFMGATGQMILKLGVNKLGSVFCSPQTVFHDLARIGSTPQVLIALVFYAAGSITWIKALSRENLSYVYPMASLSYVLVLFYSYFLFKEPLTINKIIGIFLIIGGVIFINR
jgi:drug/metabolite transporter (DMT)-like permease